MIQFVCVVFYGQIDIKEQIDTPTLNSSGTRDTASVLGINKNAVIAHLITTM